MGKKLMEHCRKSRFFRAALVTLCLLTSVGFISADTLTVTGTVTSASDGEPLIGVTVQVKGTAAGTSTDIDGNYSIKAETGKTLVFSYVGMTQREITVTGPRIDVALTKWW